MSDANVYEAPESEVLAPQTDEAELKAPISCGIGAGWTWMMDGFRLLGKGIGPSIGMLLVMVVLMFVLQIIPLVNILSGLIGPIFFAGFVFAAHRAHQQGEIQFSDLFEGFRNHFGSLLLVGLIYLAMVIVAMLVAGLVTFVLFGSAFMAAFEGGQVGDSTAALGVIFAVLIFFAVLIPVLMAFWFAPTLVVMHKLSPIDAMKLSFKGCLKNILPFLLWSIVLSIVMLLSAIPLGLGLLFTLPAAYYSIYAAYRSVYIDHD